MVLACDPEGHVPAVTLLEGARTFMKKCGKFLRSLQQALEDNYVPPRTTLLPSHPGNETDTFVLNLLPQLLPPYSPSDHKLKPPKH